MWWFKMVIERSRESQRESGKINKNIWVMFRLEIELFFLFSVFFKNRNYGLNRSWENILYFSLAR